MKRKLRAIDLYSGIGGWSIGLGMAGIEVVRAYEIWKPAASTYTKNLGHDVSISDIRRFSWKKAPKKIDVIVGSPPCTEFSFSNRGGNGNINDGLKDIAKFLDIVKRLKPKFWVMENVPRVKEILDRELKRGGKLSRYRSLNLETRIVDMSEFGLPQRRTRCIAGNIDFDRLLRYRKKCEKRVLRHVLTAVAKKTVVDPLYKMSIPKAQLTDHDEEDALSREEARYNREVKANHPVYNGMRFPDPSDEPVRTLTATCSRVSRESVVVKATPTGKRYRRLTIRERAIAQGFPITYQVFGASYNQKMEMVGNALPPLFAWYVAEAIKGTKPSRLRPVERAIRSFRGPDERPKQTRFESRPTYRASRRFRFAIRGFRFKSGVSFELSNKHEGSRVSWNINFYHGHSKDIRILKPGKRVLAKLRASRELAPLKRFVRNKLQEVALLKQRYSPRHLQLVWTKRGKGLHPFKLADKIGALARDVSREVSGLDNERAWQIVKQPLRINGDHRGTDKLRKHSRKILAGLLIGGQYNGEEFSKAKQSKTESSAHGI